MSASLPAERVGALLRLAVDIADGTADLSERRMALMQGLAQLTGSDKGYWAWARGRIDDPHYMIIGFLQFGFSDEELENLTQSGLDPRLQEELNRRLLEHLRATGRTDGGWASLSRDAFPEVAADPDCFISQWFRSIGVSRWMQAGRFYEGDAFSVMALMRRIGAAEYDDADRDLLDLAFTHIPWLWASPDERVPQQDIAALAPRQRAVAFLLIDGLSRKKIAARLGISEETVNSHVKAVFQRFGVQSAIELAAMFLRRQ